MRKLRLHRDRNGVEIREGDVLRFIPKGESSYVVAEVNWDGIHWCFGQYTVSNIDFKRCKIIASIYDNWDMND